MAILRFYQPLHGYAYNSDSLFLAHFAKDFIKKGDTLLEVGAGCGVVGLLCAREFANPLDLIEIDSNLAFFATLNSQKHPKACVICADFLEHPFNNRYHAIISNPPYYHQNSLESANTQRARATNQRFLPLQALCQKAFKLLRHRGYLIMCYHANLTDMLLNALQQVGFKALCLRFVHPFKDKKATLVLCCARKNSKSLLEILPPLITHNSKAQQDNTPEVARIYQHFKTHSIKAALE
ncbi:tRNA1(Val) (adenine(37)-N6)-methyltransferase [Helicobacter bizzozeronii]|uniref:tRNA1(Val) (adenine(37)-N6)-methyltransferase n=1 Tax=Helicobacter bizzozeronii TaxID=56877 RepID=UPI001F38F5EA|nr:methyltransferase [Helicobacter bizzozeronii]